MSTPNDVFLNQSDFSGNTYSNKVLNPGIRYRLLRDNTALLKEGMDYDRSDSGFSITSFTIEPDTTIQIQFY